MHDRADQGQREAEQGKAERDCCCRIVVADQLEFIVRGDAGIDEEIGEHRKDRDEHKEDGDHAGDAEGMEPRDWGLNQEGDRSTEDERT